MNDACRAVRTEIGVPRPSVEVPPFPFTQQMSASRKNMRRLAPNIKQVMRLPATLASLETTTKIVIIMMMMMMTMMVILLRIANISQLLVVIPTTAVTMIVMARAIGVAITAIKAAILNAITTARFLVTQAAGLHSARILRKVMDTHVYTCVLRESTGIGAGDIAATVPRASTARKN